MKNNNNNDDSVNSNSLTRFLYCRSRDSRK